METEEPNNYLYNSCIFNKKKTNDDDEDVEMKDDSSKKSEDSTYEDADGIISDKDNKNDYNKWESNKNDNKKKENKNDKSIINKSLTINQLGELSMYPDAKAIDDMD